jgi:hypothetical protein
MRNSINSTPRGLFSPFNSLKFISHNPIKKQKTSKTKNLFSNLLISFFFLLIHFSATGQMNKWVLYPNLVDFGASSTIGLNWQAQTPYAVENTAFGAGGKPLFYIQNMSVYNPDGTLAGSLPSGHSSVSGYDYSAILNEIAIVPVFGTCNQFYIIYCMNRGVIGDALKFATITVNSNGSLSISTSTALLGEYFGNSGAIAVSQVAGPNGLRHLYWVAGHGGVFQYNITGSGITLNHTIVGWDTNTLPLYYEASEAEVDNSDANLIWVNGSASSFSKSIYGPEGVQLHTLNRNASYGIEFDESQHGFYVSTGNGGIYHYPTLDPSSVPTLVSNSSGYKRTFIEKAKDGKFYAVDENGILGSYTGDGPAAPSFGGLTANSSSTFFYWLSPYYKLPDQIDGENYDYFFGVSPLDLTSFAVGTTALPLTFTPHPPAFYDCNSINLTTGFTGTMAGYTIDVYSVDPITGSKLTTPPSLFYSTSGTGSIPASLDLIHLNPSYSDLFNNASGNYLGQTFAVHVRATNACGQVDDLIGYFRVLGAPSPTTINLQVNPGTGIPCNASHSISFPCGTSVYSASLNMSNSQGDITFYTLKIDEVDCSSGSVLQNVLPVTQYNITSISQLTAVGLNDLTINGSQGYFVNKCCHCYRIEVSVGNVCGSSTDYSYVKFTLPSCNCFSGGGGGENFKSQSDQHNIATGIHIGPNPVTDRVQFFTDGSGSVLPSVKSLNIFNANGKLVLRLEYPDLNEPVNVDHLPSGFYSYTLEMESGPASGKFIKM